MIRRLLQKLGVRKEWAPRVWDVAGFCAIVVGVYVILGMGPALLAAGAAMLIVGYVVEGVS
jgi:hypothetical protein